MRVELGMRVVLPPNDAVVGDVVTVIEAAHTLVQTGCTVRWPAGSLTLHHPVDLRPAPEATA